jgi:two-component system response regulator GlrR
MATPAKILIIDDDANLRRTLVMVLEHAGYLVTPSASAAEALCCLDQRGYDLILLDVGVPETNGLDWLPELHQRHPSIPVMLLTGNTLPDPTSAHLPAGVSGYLSKPVDPEHILAQVSRLTNEKST